MAMYQQKMNIVPKMKPSYIKISLRPKAKKFSFCVRGTLFPSLSSFGILSSKAAAIPIALQDANVMSF